MQTAHTLSPAAEVCFVDSTASCDAGNHVITFMLVTSPYGAVPAGVVITGGENETEYQAGFSALKNLLDASCFGGEGRPGVFIIDDSSADRAALHTVLPGTVQRLCHFHVMQAVWRWLWDAKRAVAK